MRKILIVDDDEKNLYYLEALFKTQGFYVVTAKNGEEALEAARKDPPHIIISDILMPVMDGFKLCREWKKDGQLMRIPFVFYTATYTDPKDEKLALDIGADLFIVKPQEPDVLLGLIKKAMAKGESETAEIKKETEPSEEVFLREYNETLFRKLEKKVQQLETANQALKDSEMNYRSIFENSLEGIYRTTKEGQFLIANPAFCRMLGYSSFEELEEKINDIGNQLYVNPEDRSHLIRLLGQNNTVEGFETRFFKKDGKTLWVELNIRAIHDEQGNLLYYEGIDEDITPRKQAENNMQQGMERLQKAIEGIINVIVTVVEARDPYTSGHQKRVAKLAQAIAVEMGLSSQQIEGIRMAGVIHDLGKISIPTEILSMPRKLTDIEFSLVKAHSELGYTILKDIEFPWPIAQMILQHHEKINGTGYPQGLKGDHIMLEARILVIADVVEAMASYRPYRPALGIEAALEEIEKNKGLLYDPEVVDACLKLFREKGFQFEKEN
jgi:PAS domain S-box-containing protein